MEKSFMTIHQKWSFCVPQEEEEEEEEEEENSCSSIKTTAFIFEWTIPLTTYVLAKPY